MASSTKSSSNGQQVVRPHRGVNRRSLLAFTVVTVMVLFGAYVGWVFYGDLRDSKPVACDLMPPAAEAQQVISEHQETIRSLQALSSGGGIWVEAGMDVCPGKADILILYGTESQKKKIKNILGPDFFGVPYRLANI